MSNADKNLGLIILDNGGGITLHMGEFAHYYDGGADQAALDISTWLDDADTSDYEGHEEAATEEPSDEDVRSGGYLVIRLDRDMDTVASLSAEIAKKAEQWANGEQLAKALLFAQA